MSFGEVCDFLEEEIDGDVKFICAVEIEYW
jgi:hypothetical protein